MIEPIQTSNDSEALASPMTAEAKNANEGPEMAETGSPRTKPEPENAASKRPRNGLHRVRLGETRADRAIAGSPTVRKRQSSLPATQ